MYIPFTSDYSSLRTPAFVAAETARQNARRAAIIQAMTNGNQVLGALVTDCCSDPAHGGQGYYDASGSASALTALLTPSASTPTGAFAIGAGSPAIGTGPGAGAGGAGIPGVSSSDPDTAALIAQSSGYPLTPVDILTGTYGFRLRRDGGPWPRPRGAASERQRRVNAFPAYGPAFDTSNLVPSCPCASNAAPPNAVPAVSAPAPAPPCPYPACSTGNVCLDLVTGCVLNSQIDPAQQQACALANYGVFGNRGTFLGSIIHACPNPPYLGTPLPNPRQADPSMVALMNSKGLSGLGQADGTSNMGGLLAILGFFGIVVWATRK